MYKTLAVLILLFVVAHPVFAKTGIEKALSKASDDMQKELNAAKIKVSPDESITLLGITDKNGRRKDVEDLLYLKLQKLGKFNMMNMERAREIVPDFVEYNMTDVVDRRELARIADEYNKRLDSPELKPISGVVTGKIEDRKDHKQLYLYLTLLDGTDAWTAGFRVYPKKSTFLAGIRSALIPGWGQLYNRDWIKAGGFITTAAIVAGGTLKYHQDYSDAHDKYMKARELDEIEYYREEQKDPRTYRNVLFVSYLAINVFSFGEAILDASGVEIEEAKVESLSLTPRQGSVYLAYTVRF